MHPKAGKRDYRFDSEEQEISQIVPVGPTTWFTARRQEQRDYHQYVWQVTPLQQLGGVIDGTGIDRE